MTGSGGGAGAAGAPQQQPKYPYHPGSIVKIRMHNFLTYADAEVRPGPRLNMVVGPNGSGKSTILCAISLGLGSNYTALERAGSVGDYVMRDKEKGWIEITLKGKRARDPDVKIRRDLERGTNKSKWKIDDEAATGTRVQEVVKELGIETNNLCTFLPQEKVGKFTEMDAQQLLLETEKSLTATDLYDTHCQLVDMQKSMQSADKDRDTAKDQLEKKEAELANLQRSKEQLENRQKLLAKAGVYEKVALSLEFGKNQVGATRARNEKEALGEELKAAQARLEPYNQRVQTFKQAAQEANTAVNRSQAAYDKARDNLQEAGAAEVEERHDELHKAKEGLKMLAQQRAKLEERHRKMQKQLQEAIRLRDQADVNVLKEEAAAVNSKWREFKADHEERARALHTKQREQQDAARGEQESKKRLQQLMDIKNRRLRNLAAQNRGKFTHGRDAAEAFVWVEKNRDRFHGRVYGPVALEMSVESQEHAAMVEQQMAGYALLAFVVENEHDKKVLLDECKDRQKLKITVTQLTERWRQELNQEYYTNEDLQKLRSKGIHGVMEQFIKAPDQVKFALRTLGNVHRVLVGDAKTEQYVSQQTLMEDLCAMGGSGALARGGGGGDDDERKGNAVVYTRRPGRDGALIVHRATVSRYSGEVSTQSRMVEAPKVLGAFQADDDHEKAVKELQEELAKHKADLAQLGRDIVEATELEEAAGKKKVKLEKELKVRREAITAAMGATDKVKRLTATVQEVEAELAQDAGAQRQELEQQTLAAARALVDATVRLGNRVEGVVGAWVARAPPKLAHSAALKLQQAADRELKAAGELHRGLAERVEAKEKEYRVKIEALKRQKAEIKDKLGRGADAEKVKELIDTEYNAQAKREEDETLEEAFERLLVDCQTEKDAAEEEAARIVDNPEALAQYERVSKEVAALRKRTEELQRRCDSGLTDLERLAGPWAEALRNLTAKLTLRFSEYMTQMGCEGEVTLMEEGDNYEAWRLQIWVKFRKEASLQQLSAKVHSGGERSVSTILFLMGLQDVLGASPFRAVDEINQGMDERNERLVFSRIVANSTKNQYFLVTPKLLPGLTAMEMDHVTVLFVFNAPELLPFDRWDVRAFLQAAAQRKRLGGGGGGGGAAGGGGKRGRSSAALEEDKESEDEEEVDDQGEGARAKGKKRRSEGEAVRP